jgi:hypothetical protein
MQVKLWQWQIDRFKAEKQCSGAAILRHAVKRYQRGDFAACESVVQSDDLKTNGEKVPPEHWQLAGYPVKHRFGIPDSVLRDILAWHWLLPDEVLRAECSKEIKRLDKEIEEMFKAYTGVEYIKEETEQ